MLESKRRDPRRVVMMFFAIGSSIVLGGNRPACDNRPPSLTCDVVSVRLDPGSCVEIQNPCDDQWVRLDAFRLCDEPVGLFIQTQRDPRARFLCADAAIRTMIDVPVDFFYSRPRETGVGTLRVTVGATPLEVTASATPSTINAGESSQLVTKASGGLPPYTYAWSPASGLNATDLADPLASPSVSTQYTVIVTDSSGATAGAAVIVNVGLSAVAQASPAVIDFGQTSNLSLLVAGGTPPYMFAWTPSDTLSAANIGSPVATPLVTTTYDVTVTDFLGASAIASVTVEVNLSASATANPGSVMTGGQSQLDVAVIGGSPPYTFSWSPAATLDDSTVQNPIASPNATTTYDVIVTDSRGGQVSASTTVSVIAAGVTACFTIQVFPGSAQGDASCSTGNIVQYRWWPDFRSVTQPPSAVTTTPISPVFRYEFGGPKTMRLEVVDGTGATGVYQQLFVIN